MRSAVASSLIVRMVFVVILQLGIRFVDSQGDSKDDKEEQIPSQVTVTSWNDMPFSGVANDSGKWVGKGYAFYIFDIISRKLNFSYKIVPPKEHILGNQESGVLGMLYQKKVHMAVAFLPVLPEMQRYCTFSTALDETRLTALMKRPQESATGSGLLAPFDKTVWLLVLATLIFMGPVIYIFAYIRGKLWNDPQAENFNIPSCFWFVYSSLLKQGTNIIATTDSTRMLFATWWFFILILTSFYTANLTAFLTKPQFTLSISSLEDIVSKGYNWITYRGRTVDFLLSQHNPNELSLLNTSIRRGKGVFKYNEPSKAILETVDTKKLFLAEAHYLQTLIFNDYVNKTHDQLDHGHRCTYVIMPGSILIANRAFAFRNDSGIEKSVNEVLLRLVETGIIQQKKKEDLPLAEICPVDLRSTERRLRNTDLLLTYQVVVTGYGIGALVFLLEIILMIILNRVKRGDVENRPPNSDSINNKRNWLFCCTSKMTTEDSVSIAQSISVNDNVPSTENIAVGKNQANLLKESPRQVYQNVENKFRDGEKHYFNGRTYYVVVDGDGVQRSIPMRTPSAFLFQYAA